MIVTELTKSHPPDSVLGRWGSSSTCVLVGPRQVICARHQGGGIGTKVTLAGQTYIVSEVTDSTLDLRVASLVDLKGKPVFLHPWAKVGELVLKGFPTAVVVGGWGLGTRDVGFPYRWNGARELRWGDGLLTGRFSTIDVIQGPSYLTAGDSGGGWFYLDEKGEWRVFGLSVSTERSGETRELDRGFGMVLPVGWLVERIFEKGDIDLNGGVEPTDMAILVNALNGQMKLDAVSLHQADMNGDGALEPTDMAMMVNRLNGRVSNPPDTAIVKDSASTTTDSKLAETINTLRGLDLASDAAQLGGAVREAVAGRPEELKSILLRLGGALIGRPLGD